MRKNLRKKCLHFFNKDTVPVEFEFIIGYMEITPDFIRVYKCALCEVVVQIAELLLPLLKNQKFQVVDEEYGGDITDKVTTPELLFYNG